MTSLRDEPLSRPIETSEAIGADSQRGGLAKESHEGAFHRVPRQKGTTRAFFSPLGVSPVFGNATRRKNLARPPSDEFHSETCTARRSTVLCRVIRATVSIARKKKKHSETSRDSPSIILRFSIASPVPGFSGRDARKIARSGSKGFPIVRPPSCPTSEIELSEATTVGANRTVSPKNARNSQFSRSLRAFHAASVARPLSRGSEGTKRRTIRKRH